MARTGNNQRSANRVAVDVGATGNKPASKGAVLILVVSVLAAVWAVAMMTVPGRVGYMFFFIYSEYYMGVITLVALSITIMVGLVATDRLVLSIRQRVLLQSAHRTTGLIAVTSLFIHVWTKLAEGHVHLIDAFVPFLALGNRWYVGFGTLSGWVMMMVMWTGLARSRFIGKGAPWMWRSIHAIAYLMWPLALVHGLAAGRAAKAWVIVSYILCILLVLVGLAVRLSVSLNRNKDFSSTSAPGIKPVGSLVPTTAPAMKKPRRREREQPEVLGPVAVVDQFQPSMPPSRQALPPLEGEPIPARGGRRMPDGDLVAPRQRRAPEYEEERPRGRRRVEEEIEYDEPGPRGGRRYPGEDTSTRMRRPELEDTSARMRRPELEDTSTRMRRIEMDDTRGFRPDFDEPAPRQRHYEDDEPVPRSRRRSAEPMYEEAPRGRRRAEGYDDTPRGRYDDEPSGRRGGGGRFDPRFGEAEDAPRARRDRGADIDRADSGRHSRSGFVDLADDPDYLEPDETPTLVDMASRRARRADTQEPVRSQAGPGARRNGRGRRGDVDDEVADEAYWSQLRGEAN